jgi:hypothetical protein
MGCIMNVLPCLQRSRFKHTSKLYTGSEYMQATAEAITLGECMNSNAISGVLAEAGAKFDAFSTCGPSANSMEAPPDVVLEEIARADAARAARRK